MYEAVGLGVPAVVSDIPINQEIDQGEIYFFKSGDSHHLAERVTELLSHPPHRLNPEELIARGNANLRRLGKAIHGHLVDMQAG